MIPELISAGFLLTAFVYNRWREEQEKQKRLYEPHEIQIPQSEDGADIPLIFGTCRVRQPIIAWTYVKGFSSLDDTILNMVFVIGIPMNDGNCQLRVKRMWGGDQLIYSDSTTGSTGYQYGTGGPEQPMPVFSTYGQGTGYWEYLSGGPSQVLANDGDDYTNAPTMTGRMMLRRMSASEISGYRGYVTAGLFGDFTIDEGSSNEWVAPAGAVPAYSFEVQSYVDAYSYPGVGVYGAIGPDSNPVNVIYDILTAKMGKLGLPVALIDTASFDAAATTLYTESHGYSRAFEQSMEAERMIQEVLTQIDGVLDEDPTTGKIKIKLIRNDYDPATVPHITKENCEGLENLAVGGWTNIVNKVRVSFTDRDHDYQEGSAYAINMANAVGQDGLAREIVIRYPGVTHLTLAENLAARELAARSRPIIRMRAIVDRSFIRVMRGDAVKVTWTDPDIGSLIFRVADVDRGTLDDGKIALDLIQDYFYVYRGRIPETPGDWTPPPPDLVLG
jgi:hypothetical protein